MTHKRIDSNQKEIVSALRKLGASVLIMSDLGNGAPDAAVGYKGHTYFLEIKDGSKPPSKQRLTPLEQLFFNTWRGHVCIIKSVTEAVDFVNSI